VKLLNDEEAKLTASEKEALKVFFTFNRSRE
jgi:hypothetical protein